MTAQISPTRAHIITGGFGHSATGDANERSQIQSADVLLSDKDSAYRRDSCIEIVLTSQPTDEFLEAWRTLLRDAALRPR